MWWLAGRAITVAGTNRGDFRIEASNWGPCVDLFAPSDDVLAAASGGGTSLRRGTSFAAPHVTGAAAMLLENAPSLDPAALKSEILSRATVGAVRMGGDGSPNRLPFVR